MIKKISVSLKKKSYSIIIGFKIFKKSDFLFYFSKNKRYFLITNNTLLSIWAKKILQIFKKNNINIDIIVISDGEIYKKIEQVDYIIKELLKKNCSRNDVLVAFGGGVIGDITGFVASIYQRGISFIQIPTTLLAQVDASIGGKTGVNHALGKNMIGTFWQPKVVIIDLFFLSTLSKRELLSGFSEVIKYAISFDKKFFIWLEKTFFRLINLEKKSLLYCVKKCCKIKAKIVSLDEKEKNLRALLNFGHTYGHAIESCTNYKNFLHGEAISIGMILSARTAEILGILEISQVKKIISLLNKFQLPIFFPKKIPLLNYISYMKRDKKNSYGKIKLILPFKIGLVKIYDNIKEEVILSSIKNSFEKI
ncbi:3-dehydroquinate synthase [Buchnera aphidicola]|uniref:3-dehydroquinate synthase n=1 Tax=Buchnera aphidicola TaxID=9 RepID=UPI00209211C0|nr:3-dehydroquinate synthase [Buchnera aphidicola]USS94096.1 3-dehydroquinate synthase [Buchnera aphidicola (Sipha maydis)]WII23641.1 3-dehydroquinate synthase [Buchnera aphidicola (Sipha maydis)]